MEEKTFPTPAASKPEDLSLMSRIINLFTNPSATFKAVQIRPSWLVPALIVLVLSIGSTYFLKPVILAEQHRQMVNRMEDRGMSQEQIDLAIEQGNKFMKYTFYPFAIAGIIGVLLVTAAIWLFVSRTILGGTARYAHLLEVTAYTSLISVVGALIKLPIMLQKESINVHFSLATFMADSAKDTFLYKVLVNTDLFNIWSVALLCIGIAVVNGLKVKKVWPVVVGLLIVWYLGSAAIGKVLGG